MRPAFPLAVLSLCAAPAAAGGDVKVAIDSEGDLVVLGDDEANALDVPEKGDFLIVGVDGTTINGGTEPFVVPDFLRGRLLIDLGGGDDSIEFRDARFRNRPSHIRLGAGDDVLFWTNGQNGAFVIDGGPGDDVIDMEATDFAALLLLGGEGADRFVHTFASVFGPLGVRGGDGDDRLTLDEVHVRGSASLHGGLGLDTLVQGDDLQFDAGPPKLGGWESR